MRKLALITMVLILVTGCINRTDALKQYEERQTVKKVYDSKPGEDLPKGVWISRVRDCEYVFYYHNGRTEMEHYADCDNPNHKK